VPATPYPFRRTCWRSANKWIIIGLNNKSNYCLFELVLPRHGARSARHVSNLRSCSVVDGSNSFDHLKKSPAARSDSFGH
jgi:hypothetical protein